MTDRLVGAELFHAQGRTDWWSQTCRS